MHNLLKKLMILFVLAGSTSFSLPTDPIPSLNSIRSKTAGLNNRLSSAYAPTFSNCPTDITNVMPNSGDCMAAVTWAPPTATGLGPVMMTSNYAPGNSFSPGRHRVIYRATDSSGDTSFCEFTVEVLDNQSPTITVPADITRSADPGSCGAVVTFPYPTATDNCPAGEGAPINQNFDGSDDLSTQCYDFGGTFVGSAGSINGSVGELETVELIRNDKRTFTSPLTKFNGTGEIFFDHRIIAGSPSGTIGNNTRITVKMITPAAVETVIFSEQYIDENLQTEYIDVPQVGNYYVQFEWETDQNRDDIVYLDDLYVPGYVISDKTTVACNAAVHRAVQIAGQPYRSGLEFPVGTTTLQYLTRDAAGNVGFNSFKVIITNNITPPNGSDENYCEGSPVPILTVSVGPGQTVDWYDAAVGGTLLLAGNTSYQPAGPGDYYAETRNIATGCVSATRRKIHLTEDAKPTAPISSSPIEYCIGDPATQLTATGDMGNMIFWYNAPTGGTMYPDVPTPDTSTAQTIFYYVEQIDADTGCISDRTEVVVTVYALPLAPMVITPIEYCIGDTAEELTNSVTNGTDLRWYDAASGGNEILGTTKPTTTIAGQQFYWITQSSTSGSANCESNRTRLTINVNTPPNISLQPLGRSVCETGNATFAVAASDTATFQWQLFDGSNWNDLTNTAPYSGAASNTLTITNVILALNGNQYRAVASSPAASCADAISNSAILTVNAAPLAPTGGGDQAECEQDPIQTLTATANPPSGASIVWYDAASGGNVVANSILDAVGTVTYYAQSNDSGNSCPSVGRTPVTLTIQPAPATPTSGGDQTECVQSPIQTLTATANPPSGANVVWYDAASGGNVVTDPTLNAVGTIAYYAESNDVGTGCRSTSRTAVTLSIQPAPAPPISGGDQTECEASPTQTLTATATVPVGNTITWFDAASGGNTVGSPTLNSIGTITYYAESTNDGTSCESTSRTSVTLTIGAVPAAPTSGGDQTECEASPTQTITATSTAPVGSTVVWFDAASGGNIVGSPTLNSIGTTTYYAESRTTGSGCVSDSRTPVTLSMNARPTISVTPVSQSCSADLSTYSVSVDVNRGTVTSLEGTVTANGGNNWTISNVTSGNTIIVTVTDGNSCEETISINAPNCSCPAVSAPTSSGDQTECEKNPIQTLTATATAPSGASVVWYDAAINGTVVSNPILNSVGSITYYAEGVDDVNGCTSSTRTAVSLKLQAAPSVPTSGGDQTECEATPTQTLTATATCATGTTVVWYDAASNGNTVATPTLNTVGTMTYYAESRDNSTNCASHSRTAVTLILQPNPAAPTSGGDQTECEESPIRTLTAVATPPPGAGVAWYDAAIGGNLVADPILNAVGRVTYFAESRDNTTSCMSFDRVPVTLTLHALPNVVASATTTNIDAGEPVTLTGSGADSYVWNNGSNDGDPVFPLTTTTYTVIGTDANGCENTDSVTIIVGATSDIRLQKTVDTAFPNVGDTVTFTLTATNDGPSDDTGGSVVNDILPAGYTYTADTGSATNGTYDNASGDWTLPALNNGNSISIAISASVNAPTGAANEYLNRIQVTSAENFDNDSTPNNDDGDQSEDDEAAVSITPQVADLEVTNSISQPTANPGDALTLTVDVINKGPNDATNVSIENIVPDGFTVTAINNKGSQAGNAILWSGIDIPTGATMTLTFEITVNRSTNTPYEYLNTVQVTAVDQFDGDSAPNNDDGDQSEDDEAHYNIVAPTVDIEIAKTVDKTQTFFGDTVVFTVTATNNSTYDATHIGIEDVLPGGYSLASHTADLGAYDEATATWEIDSIPFGETATLEMTATVTETEDYTNIAELIYIDQIDSNIANDRAEATPEITQRECLTVFNEFSPNDDGANDFFFIECIENYPNSLLQIYNRWGNQVFAAKGYDNSWDGTSVNRSTIGTSEKLPVGTYYYTLAPGDGNASAKSGWLYISR